MHFRNPVTRADVSTDGEGKAMDEPVRWVTKAEAAEELEISLSTLDRKIRKGEVEVAREGRRVYVGMHGPERLSDEELLRRAIIGEDELERERDEAGDAAAAGRQAYAKLEESYRKEETAHRQTKQLAAKLGVAAAVLFVLLVLLAVGVLVALRLCM